MTAIEACATIFAVLILVKLAVVMTVPRLWMSLAGALWKNSIVATLIYLVLAVIVGVYVLASMSIVQVGAVMLLTSLLMGVGLAPYAKILLKVAEEVMTEGVGKAWLSSLVWAGLAIGILYTVFAQGGS